MDSEHAVGVRSVAYYAFDFRRSQASGLVTYVRSMRDALTARGVQVRVMTRDADAGDTSAEILRTPAWLRRSSGLATRLAKSRSASFEESATIAACALGLERREQTALFEIEEHMGLASWLLRTPLRAPVIVRTHGPYFLVAHANHWPWDERAVHGDRRERATAERAFALTVPSRDTLARIREHWQLPLAHARVIPNSSPVVPEALCWAGRTDGPIVFIGRSDRLKGMDLVVRAFGRLSPQFPERELWLVGPEYDLRENGRTYPKLQDFLEVALPDAAVRGRVRYLGQKSADEVQALRRDAGCVIVASRFETFCLAAVEAMMAGCPLVAPNASALPELIDDDVSGLLFRSEDADDLARVLTRLLQDPALALRLGKKAREVGMQRFAPDVVIGTTLQFYAETVAAARRERRPSWLRALAGPQR